jgi:hypothetical protein
MDRGARQRLIDRASSLFDNGFLAAVPAEDFFVGNTDDGSFGRHMQTSRDIPVIEYAAGFREIAARPEVRGVWVKVHELPDDADPVEREMWPSAFVVFVITSATSVEVEDWLRPLEARYADAEWRPSSGMAVPWTEPPAGMHVVLVEML